MYLCMNVNYSCNYCGKGQIIRIITPRWILKKFDLSMYNLHCTIYIVHACELLFQSMRKWLKNWIRIIIWMWNYRMSGWGLPSMLTNYTEMVPDVWDDPSQSRVLHFDFKTSRFRNFSIFLTVSDSTLEKIDFKRYIGIPGFFGMISR